MATAEVKKELVVTLHLTGDEALFIMDSMQNPLHDMETTQEETFRKGIFEAIADSLSKEIKS